jgi:hypothetical protein
MYVIVLSGPSYLADGPGRVVVCRVIPGATPEDFAGVHSVTYTDPNGVTTIGLAVPELIEWYPRSGLSEPVGLVNNMRPLLGLVHALFE